MSKVSWKGSILDTYNAGSKFGGREGDDAKTADKQAVDFIKTIINGKVAVGGFTRERRGKKETTEYILEDAVLDKVRTEAAEKSPFAIGVKYEGKVNKG